MEQKSSYSYIHVGLLIRLLANVSSKNPRSFVLEHIRKLESELGRVGFQVSIAGANDLRDVRAAIEAAPDGELGNELHGTLDDAMRPFEKTVFAESMTKTIYIYPQRRFNQEYLLAEPAKLLKAGVFDKLDAIARLDFASSARCVLFGEATAAAFHVLRATEGVLRAYYKAHKKRDRIPTLLWGPMVTDMRAKKTHRPPEQLLSALDTIRTAYRNPTQHPDATYDVDGAQDLMGVCIDVINKMASDS